MADYISVDDLAAQLGISDDADATLLASAITASSNAVSSWCGRQFTPDTAATARLFYPRSPHCCPIDDVWDATSLIVKTDSGDRGSFDQTWAVTTDYEVAPANRVIGGVAGWPIDELVAVGSRWFPSYRRPSVRVTAKWGWAAIPEEVQQATKLKAARLFQRKDAVSQGSIGGGSGFAVPLIRVDVREDPDVVALLSPFVRYSGVSSRFLVG